jgi:hypothetical protein
MKKYELLDDLLEHVNEEITDLWNDSTCKADVPYVTVQLYKNAKLTGFFARVGIAASAIVPAAVIYYAGAALFERLRQKRR